MKDNYYMSDLLASVRKDTTPERYLPLMEVREALSSFLLERGIVRRPQVTSELLTEISERFGIAAAKLLAGLMHIYDFNPVKLKDIRAYEGHGKIRAAQEPAPPARRAAFAGGAVPEQRRVP